MRIITIYNAVLASKFENVDEQVKEACLKYRERLEARKIVLDKWKTEKEIFELDYVLREMLNNAIEHGNKFDEIKNVKLNVCLIDSLLTIEVEDQGNGFDLSDTVKGMNDDILRERNRGISSLLRLGYKIRVEKSKVVSDKNIKILENFFLEGNVMDILVENDVIYVTLHKSIIAPNVKGLVEEFIEILEKRTDYKKVIIDLSCSENIDSMGITFLIGIYKSFKGKGKVVALKSASEGMLELFKIMKIDEIFEILE